MNVCTGLFHASVSNFILYCANSSNFHSHSLLLQLWQLGFSPGLHPSLYISFFSSLAVCFTQDFSPISCGFSPYIPPPPFFFSHFTMKFPPSISFSHLPLSNNIFWNIIYFWWFLVIIFQAIVYLLISSTCWRPFNLSSFFPAIHYLLPYYLISLTQSLQVYV